MTNNQINKMLAEYDDSASISITSEMLAAIHTAGIYPQFEALLRAVMQCENDAYWDNGGYADLNHFFRLAPVLLSILIPALTMRQFAEDEFDVSMGQAIDKAIAFKEEIEHLNEEMLEKFNRLDAVPKNEGYSLIKLEASDTPSSVACQHFGFPGFYRYGEFIVGKQQQIVTFVENEKTITFPRRFYQQKLYELAN